jgi:hypothetical protein
MTDIEAIGTRHRRGIVSTYLGTVADRAECMKCHLPWPCDTAIVMERLRAAEAALDAQTDAAIKVVRHLGSHGGSTP